MLLLSYFQVSCMVVTLSNWYWEQHAAMCDNTAELWNWKEKAVLWLSNGLTVTVSHTWALTLWHSFTLCLRKCNNNHGLFNDEVGAPVPLHDTVQWRLNAIHDGCEDAKNCNCKCTEIHTVSVLVFFLSTQGRERPTQSAFHTRWMTLST